MVQIIRNVGKSAFSCGTYTRQDNKINCLARAALAFIKHPLSDFLQRYFFPVQQNTYAINATRQPHKKHSRCDHQYQ
jgi:hypothetical protein